MLDVSHIPSQYGSNVQVFTANSVVAGVTWQQWIKPRGASMVHIMLLGGGGAGSSGASGAASTAAGGGGGGSSAQCIAMFNAAFLPDTLYISVGVGGVGTSNAAGTSGIASYVSLKPLNTPVNHLLMQASGGSAPASRPFNATAGVAGGAGGATTIANCPGIGAGQPSWGAAATNVSLVGQAGAAGGTTGVGPSVTLPVTGLLVTGGAGGAGLGALSAAGALGGGWTVPAGGFFFPASFTQIAATNTNAPGNMGSNGISFLNKMFFHLGGTGGGAGGLGATGNATAVGGAGGAGGIGCGGGGGGAGFTGGTNGPGGNGGDGICIITCW